MRALGAIRTHRVMRTCGAGSRHSQATLGWNRPLGPRYNNTGFGRSAPLNHRPRLRNVIREPPPAEPVPVAIPGPVDEEGLALDLVALDEAPVAAVLRVVAIVAHHEVRVGRHERGLAAVRVAAVGVATAHGRVGELRVGLAQRLAVDEDLVAFHLHALARRRDDPLDEVALLVL